MVGTRTAQEFERSELYGRPSGYAPPYTMIASACDGFVIGAWKGPRCVWILQAQCLSSSGRARKRPRVASATVNRVGEADPTLGVETQ